MSSEATIGAICGSLFAVGVILVLMIIIFEKWK